MTQAPATLQVRDAVVATPSKRQFVRFAFYRIQPEWRRLSDEKKRADRDELTRTFNEFAQRDGIILRSFSTVGTRGDCDLMFWVVSEELSDFHDFSAQLNASSMAQYLETPYHYFAMTKPSNYVEKHQHTDGKPQEGRSSRLVISPTDRKYLFVYPFVKTRAWYQLSKEERQRQMTDHIATGHRYPSVKINTTYSFGLDDQEFVVAFESDSVADFLDLVQELRGGEASTHTVRDTPSFTCIAMPIAEALAALG